VNKYDWHPAGKTKQDPEENKNIQRTSTTHNQRLRVFVTPYRRVKL